ERWRHPWETTLDANVAMPIFHNNRLFLSSGYDTGCALFEMLSNDDQIEAKMLWENKKMKIEQLMNTFSEDVLVNFFQASSDKFRYISEDKTHLLKEEQQQYCQYAFKIDPLCALKTDPPPALIWVLYLLHIGFLFLLYKRVGETDLQISGSIQPF
ncbi:MAG: hypothetical protein IIB77_09440, partial [Proteobacteria bacterium]|nr:hypothetical protein [Pseudomonadota bacterium]